MQIDFVTKECPVVLALLLRKKIMDLNKYTSCVVDWLCRLEYVDTTLSLNYRFGHIVESDLLK